MISAPRYHPYERPDDMTPGCDEDIRRALSERRTWHDQPLDIQRLQAELAKSLAQRARRNTMVDVAPWIERRHFK